MPFKSTARALAGLAIALSLATANAAVSIRTISSSGSTKLKAVPKLEVKADKSADLEG